MSDQGKFSTQKSVSSVTMPSTSKSVSNMTRMQRNVAEKQRRDKLNGYISELANIVPMVSMSSKRLDKTSILRLSAAHLRLSKSPLSGSKKLKKSFKWCPSFLTAEQVREILESVDGFLIVTSSSGKILFTSGSVERYLGHQNIDMIGHSLFVFIHPEDTDSVKEELDRLLTESLKCGDSTAAPRCSFHCRMREKGQPRSEVATYHCVHFSGDMTICDDENGSNGNPKNSAVITHIFKAFVRVVDENPYSQLSLEDACADEYVTRHSLDGTIIFADHRLSTITGHLPQEVIGMSAYKFILPEDTAVALFAHHLMFSSDKGTGMIVYRLRTRDDKYVYLKSVGCLQYDHSTSQVDHFVCVNQYLSDSEGEVQLKYFVDRFVPHIKDSSAVTLLESVKTLQVVGLESPTVINNIKEMFSSVVSSKQTKPNISINGTVLNNKISKTVSDISSAKPELSKSVVHFSESSSKCGVKRQTPSPQEIKTENDTSQASSSPLSQDLQNKTLSRKRRASSTVSQNSAISDVKNTKCNSVSSVSSENSAVLTLPKVVQSSGDIVLKAADCHLLQSQNNSIKGEKSPVNAEVHISNTVTDYQNLLKASGSKILDNSNCEQMNMSQVAVAKDAKDSSFQLSQANDAMSGILIHSPPKTEETVKVYTQLGLPNVYALSSENLMYARNNILLSPGTVLYNNDLQVEALKANLDSCELVPVQNSSFSTNSVKHSDLNQISSSVNDVIIETTLWPTEMSSESSTSNPVNEETLSTSVECSGDNLYFLPGEEMKDYLSGSDDISRLLHSTMPQEDSSLPSVDGWSECFRPEIVQNPQNLDVGIHVDGEQSLVKIYEEKSFENC